MNAVIYARFLSHSQREQSIEGQFKTCYKFAADNGYTVTGEYIDRAQSGTNDNRAEFQRMIVDSNKHTFNAVIVREIFEHYGKGETVMDIIKDLNARQTPKLLIRRSVRLWLWTLHQKNGSTNCG